MVAPLFKLDAGTLENFTHVENPEELMCMPGCGLGFRTLGQDYTEIRIYNHYMIGEEEHAGINDLLIEIVKPSIENRDFLPVLSFTHGTAEVSFFTQMESQETQNKSKIILFRDNMGRLNNVREYPALAGGFNYFYCAPNELGIQDEGLFVIYSELLINEGLFDPLDTFW